MSILSIAQRRIATVTVDASLREAARLMRDRHVGALAIVQSDGDAATLAGMVTDRDLVVCALAEGTSPDLPVGRLARGGVVTIPHTATKGDAAAAMREAGVRRLLIVDDAQRLVGIVSLDDLLAAYADELGDLADALQHGIDLETEHLAFDAGERVLQVPENLAHAWRQAVNP